MKRLREPALVVAAFAVLTALVLRPLPFHLATLAYQPAQGDGQYSVWNIAWVARALVFHPLQLFDANIFYPHRWTLAYSEMNLAAGAIAAPVYAATRSAYAAHNFAVLVSFILSGTGMYYLARRVSGDRRAAFIAAIPFAFCPHVFAHLLHIQLLMTAGLPVTLLAFHRLVDRPTAGRGAMLGLAMAAQAYMCAYYSVFALLMIGFAVVAIVAMRRLWLDRPFWTAIGIGAVVALVFAAPLAVAAFYLQQSGFNRSLGAAQMYSADWRAYLASAATLHGWMLKYLGHWKEVLFPGFLATIFGVAGALAGWRAGGRRREAVMLYAGLVVTAAWASFGPDAGLYRVFYAVVPTFSLMRAPSRFGLVVVFGLCVLASVGLAALFARVQRAGVVALVLVAVAVAEAQVPLAFEPAFEPHPAYRLLATLPDGPLVELPIYSRVLGFRRAKYMLDSTTHWKPLVDAYSDYIPPDFDARAETLAFFPSVDALRDLKRDRVRYAIVHLEPYEGQMRAELDQRLKEFAPYLRQLYADEGLVLFEIARYPD